MPVKVWKSDKDGTLYHDGCFEEGESKDGFTAVSLDDISEDDECEECAGPFVMGPDDDDDDDGKDDDD